MNFDHKKNVSALISPDYKKPANIFFCFKEIGDSEQKTLQAVESTR